MRRGMSLMSITSSSRFASKAILVRTAMSAMTSLVSLMVFLFSVVFIGMFFIGGYGAGSGSGAV